MRENKEGCLKSKAGKLTNIEIFTPSLKNLC
jgi:hypothetical protein